MSIRIFVTGASGLLGSKLAEIASKEGHEVISGYNRNLPEKGTPVRFDLSGDNSIRKAVEQAQPEVVFHTAA